MSDVVSPNARRWLDTISFAEGTWGGAAPRYDITFGYKPIKDLSRHPSQVVHGGGYSSAAAGAYQFMPGTWAGIAKQQGLKDFGPRSQDIAALALLRQKGIDPDRDPITRENVAKVAGTWASLPTLQGESAYGQPVKTFEALRQFAEKRGASAATAGTPKAPAQQAAADKTSGLGQILLNKFIDMLGVSGIRGLGPRSSLPTPALPDYEETGAETSNFEKDLLLSSYLSNLDRDRNQQSLQEQTGEVLRSNAAAVEAAKAQLLAEALSAFGKPSSTI